MNAPSEIGYLYMIINVINGRFYIGSTLDYKRRFNEHKRALLARNHHSKYLQRAWDKYGDKSFKFVLLQTCLKDEMLDMEQSLLDDRLPAYNMNKKVDSRLGRKMSKEARLKMSVLKKGKSSPRKGVKLSEEARKKLSDSHKEQIPWHKGKTGVYSAETRIKMGVHNIGRPAWGNGIKGSVPWNKGIKTSEDVKMKQREAAKARPSNRKGCKWNPESKKRLSESLLKYWSERREYAMSE